MIQIQILLKVQLRNVKMKFLTIVFVAFVVAVSTTDAISPSVDIADYPEYKDLISPESIELGFCLQDSIGQLVQEIIQYIAALLLQTVPAATQVPLIPVLYAIKSLKKKTVGTILSALLDLLQVKCDLLEKVLPNVILELSINVNNLAAVLITRLPAGTTVVPFSAFLTLIGAYLQQILTVKFVNILNDIS